MAENRGTITIETLTKVAREARRRAANAMRELDLVEEYESCIDTLAAASGISVEDIFQRLWVEAE